MEADWEVEIGPDAPLIDALWPGLIDLRSDPGRVQAIQEAQQFPAFTVALLRLNGWNAGRENRSAPAVWTSKCDVWEPEAVDPDEMEAAAAESKAALACYIDLVPEDPQIFAVLLETESWARAAVSRLRAIPRGCCRMDLVIRRAILGEREGFGVTAYATACGADSASATQALEAALDALAEAICATAAAGDRRALQ